MYPTTHSKNNPCINDSYFSSGPGFRKLFASETVVGVRKYRHNNRTVKYIVIDIAVIYPSVAILQYFGGRNVAVLELSPL